jgi:hypothetical protein
MKLSSLKAKTSCAVAAAATIFVGCGVDYGDQNDVDRDDTYQETALLGETSQALQVCTDYSDGTWPGVLELCAEGVGQNHVKFIARKEGGGTFTSSGTMYLKTVYGTIDSDDILVGDEKSKDFYIYQASGSTLSYWAKFVSKAPGVVTTEAIKVSMP